MSSGWEAWADPSTDESYFKITIGRRFRFEMDREQVEMLEDAIFLIKAAFRGEIKGPLTLPLTKLPIRTAEPVGQALTSAKAGEVVPIGTVQASEGDWTVIVDPRGETEPGSYYTVEVERDAEEGWWGTLGEARELVAQLQKALRVFG